MAYIHLAVGSRNVSDECIWNFQGSRKAFRLLTFSLPNFFARFPHFFKKIFCAGSRKQKSAHCTCLVGVVSAKNKTRWFLTESHIWIYSFQKNSPAESLLRGWNSIVHFSRHPLCTLGVNWCTDWCTRGFFSPIRGQSTELCAGGDVRIDHQQMQLFFAVFVMHGGDKHTAGIDAHHRTRRQVGYSDAGLSNQLLRLIIIVNTA